MILLILTGIVEKNIKKNPTYNFLLTFKSNQFEIELCFGYIMSL